MMIAMVVTAVIVADAATVVIARVMIAAAAMVAMTATAVKMAPAMGTVTVVVMEAAMAAVGNNSNSRVVAVVALAPSTSNVCIAIEAINEGGFGPPLLFPSLLFVL